MWGVVIVRTVYEERVAEAREIERKLLQGTARLCSSPFAKAWKAIHPFKAAEALADATGRSIRAAGYVLSGEQDPDGIDIAALNIACCPKRK